MVAKGILSISLVLLLALQAEAQDRGTSHSFRFQDAELRAALDSLLRWYSVSLLYLDGDVRDKRVTTECTQCEFENALRNVTAGQGLVAIRVGDQIILRRADANEEVALVTFAGTVKDSLTGEGVVGADIVLSHHGEDVSGREAGGVGEEKAVYRWGSANKFGFFSLRNVKPGTYTVQIRRIGYRPVVEQIEIAAGSSTRDFFMAEQQVLLPEVTVEGRRSGFSAIEGISRGIYIRATPSDHNQYLLEGARIYNPLHYGGVMSTFSGDALKDVQVIAGGVPPYYGGRIGGILDVALRDGSFDQLRGGATVGSLNSNILLEGPISGATTFMASGRRGYPDFLLSNFRPPSDLRSSEAIAKITRHFNGNQRLSLSGYLGEDSYTNRIADGTEDLSNSLRWGNAAANVRWTGAVSPSLFFYASAIYTQYDFTLEHRFNTASTVPPETFSSDFSISDAAVRAHAEFFYDEYHTVLAGVELVRHRFSGRVSEFSSQIAPGVFDGLSPWELAVYFQDQWRLTPSVFAEIGARATSFVGEKGSFSAVDPRFSLLISLRDNVRLYSSLSTVNQFVHPYRNGGIFLFYPSIFLYPSARDVQPSTSLQVSLGAQKTSADDQYTFGVETYYRTTKNLHEFVYDSTAAGSLFDALIFGQGDVYGIEFKFDKRLGRLTGSFRYTYSTASNQFGELNNGRPFQPRFNRAHEMFTAFSYAVSEQWEAGLTCLLSSNELLSFGEKDEEALSPALGKATDRSFLASDGYAEPYDLNGGRLPGFQRFDLWLKHRFSWWGMPIEATLRFLNGYGLIDPFLWELNRSTDARLRWRVRFDASPLFPLYPVASVSVRF